MSLTLMSLGSTLVEGVSRYFERKAEVKEAKHKREVELASTWETESVSNNGWKDEYWTVILSIPLIGVFIPPLVPFIAEGFSVLEQTPEWYRWAVAISIASAFGFRKFAEWRGKA